ncbi:hypothetical protein AAFF_G00243900 [Aldrovandia affinis]|uniref:Uncharacterized protein n=1 Tax=Aldrovandia affinis TaxID=143900 RepID=A0AAD7RDM1_9TELE|nr:hypothetical protein AAFF_G00243900 [Aldrovandia affinis]
MQYNTLASPCRGSPLPLNDLIKEHENDALGSSALLPGQGSPLAAGARTRPLSGTLPPPARRRLNRCHLPPLAGAASLPGLPGSGVHPPLIADPRTRSPARPVCLDHPDPACLDQVARCSSGGESRQMEQ